MVVEELDLRLSNTECRELFNFLDKDGEGSISYQEFLNIHEDRRLNMDPLFNKRELENFDTDRLFKPVSKQQHDDIMDVFAKRKKMFDMFKYEGTKSLDKDVADLTNCISVKAQDYKFKKLTNNYDSSKVLRSLLNQDETSMPNLTKYENFARDAVLNRVNSNRLMTRSVSSASLSQASNNIVYGKAVKRDDIDMNHLLSDHYGRTFLKERKD